MAVQLTEKIVCATDCAAASGCAASGVDARGCVTSGASTAALEAYERALAAFQGWRTGAEVQLALALQEAPDFVMAHVLQAYLLLCNRDAQRVRARCSSEVADLIDASALLWRIHLCGAETGTRWAELAAA
jgi:hypothetical protein